jgi:hypothetical protein
MTVEMQSAETRSRSGRAWLIGLLAVVVVIAALGIGVAVHNKHEHDLRVDQLFCTLSGVSPLQEAPNTGKLCAEVLGS